MQKSANARNPCNKGFATSICNAGQLHFPFESLGTTRPAWLSTMYRDPPFEFDTAFAQVPHTPNKVTGLWKFDTCMFGIYNRAWPSLFVILPIALLSEIQGAPKIDERFGLLSTECRNLCKHVQKVTKKLIIGGRPLGTG